MDRFLLAERGFAIGFCAATALAALLISPVAAQSVGDTSKPAGTADEARLKDLKISLTAEQGSLVETLRTLMKSAKLDFVIDNELKAGTATVHLKDIPFKDALATVVKVSTVPITYEVKDGVYHFMRRVDPPDARLHSPGKRAFRVSE